MSSRFWPKDVLGNDIRKGNLISLSPGQPVIMKVMDVVEAGVIPQEDPKQPPMIKAGWITCVVQLPYQPQQPVIPIAVVVKEPEESQSRIHRV